jgi:hypothetical protein
VAEAGEASSAASPVELGGRTDSESALRALDRSDNSELVKAGACIEDFIWVLLDLKIEDGRIMTGRVDAVGKIRMLRKLGEQKLPESLFHRLSPVLDQVAAIREDRNFIAHGTWGRTKPAYTHVCLSLRPEALAPDQIVSETFPEVRMLTLIDGIEITKQGLIQLMRDYYALPGKTTPPHHQGI